jgi:hypothetical protein
MPAPRASFVTIDEHIAAGSEHVQDRLQPADRRLPPRRKPARTGTSKRRWLSGGTPSIY